MIDFLIVSVAILAQVCLSSAFVALDSIERFTSGAMLRLSILTFWVASSWASLDDAPIEGSLVVDDDCTHSDTCALNALQLKRCPFNFQHDVKETMLNMSAEIDSLNDKLVVLVAKALQGRLQPPGGCHLEGCCCLGNRSAEVHYLDQQD